MAFTLGICGILDLKTGRSAIKISVIVPVLNEENDLNRCLSALVHSANEELIVVDGGSADATVSTAREYTDKVISSKRGRGTQMNAGAKEAGGDILLFLHADCVLPEGAFGVVRETLSDQRVAAGGFRLSIEHPGLLFRVIERGANLRSALTRLVYGDQGLFMRKETFIKLGGFKNMPLMEDVEISQRLKRTGKIAFVDPPVRTLPRRWLKEGPVYTTLRDWAIAMAYTVFKVRPEKLIKHYEDIR
jgi:rSAM/selenodomain-associated transferase 2